LNQRKTNARFLGFEQLLEETPGFAHLRKRRAIAELQILAGLVWAREGGRGACPVVRPVPDGPSSYWAPASRQIQLIPAHRSAGGLLHELAHALGTRDRYEHGPAFHKRCIRLYREYGDWSGNVDFDLKERKT
jgi:hypothetical protein